jgi:hypothetical protein
MTAPRPSTYVGRYLRAMLLNHVELRKRLNATLNNGQPGWNDDEPAVLEAAVELAMHETFGDDYDVRAVTEWVARFRAAIHSAEPPPKLEVEALVRSALGETDVVISDIRPYTRYVRRLTILARAKVQLGWDEPTVDRIIVAAETKAIERGWNPPRLPEGERAWFDG